VLKRFLILKNMIFATLDHEGIASKEKGKGEKIKALDKGKY
jgi:hypothetical protein